MPKATGQHLPPAAVGREPDARAVLHWRAWNSPGFYLQDASFTSPPAAIAGNISTRGRERLLAAGSPSRGAGGVQSSCEQCPGPPCTGLGGCYLSKSSEPSLHFQESPRPSNK